MSKASRGFDVLQRTHSLSACLHASHVCRRTSFTTHSRPACLHASHAQGLKRDSPSCTVLSVCIWKTGTQQTPWVRVVTVVVHVVDEGIVLDGIFWSLLLQHRVFGFHTQFAQRILTVLAYAFVLIATPTQPILQNNGREFLEGFWVTTFRVRVNPRRSVRHVNLPFQDF